MANRAVFSSGRGKLPELLEISRLKCSNRTMLV